MTGKYNFSYNFTGNYPVDTIIFVNNSVLGLFIYMFVLTFFIALTWVFMKATNDFTLSLLRSFWVTTMLSTLIYYWGVYMNTTLFNSSFLILMYMITIFSIGVIYYQRNKISG